MLAPSERTAQKHVPGSPELAIPAMCFLLDCHFSRGSQTSYCFLSTPGFPAVRVSRSPVQGTFNKVEQTLYQEAQHSSFSWDFVSRRGDLHRCIDLSWSSENLVTSIASSGPLERWASVCSVNVFAYPLFDLWRRQEQTMVMRRMDFVQSRKALGSEHTLATTRLLCDLQPMTYPSELLICEQYQLQGS